MRERELLLIYQMGKVASSTIKATVLPLPQYEVHQVHRLVLDNIKRVHSEHRLRNWQPPTGDPGGLYLQRDIMSRRPAKVITLVREPIARNMSYYFQNLDKILGRARAHELPIEALVHGFPEHFPYSDDPLTWFDYEFAVALDAGAYGDFRETVRLPPHYLDRMLGSKYARFFFDAASLRSWRDTYMSGGSIIPRQLQNT